jgi:hypothetical protein
VKSARTASHLKLYFMHFRDEGHFCEALAVKIRNDVGEAPRGGITITVRS